MAGSSFGTFGSSQHPPRLLLPAAGGRVCELSLGPLPPWPSIPCGGPVGPPTAFGRGPVRGWGGGCSQRPFAGAFVSPVPDSPLGGALVASLPSELVAPRAARGCHRAEASTADRTPPSDPSSRRPFGSGGRTRSSRGSAPAPRSSARSRDVPSLLPRRRTLELRRRSPPSTISKRPSRAALGIPEEQGTNLRPQALSNSVAGRPESKLRAEIPEGVAGEGVAAHQLGEGESPSPPGPCLDVRTTFRRRIRRQ